jgi:hypothetical protein
LDWGSVLMKEMPSMGFPVRSWSMAGSVQYFEREGSSRCGSVNVISNHYRG